MDLNGFILIKDDDDSHVLLEYVNGEQVDCIQIAEDSKRKAFKKAREILKNEKVHIEYYESMDDFTDDCIDKAIDEALENGFDEEELELDDIEDEDDELESDDDIEEEGLTPEELEGFEDLAEYFADPNHWPND